MFDPNFYKEWFKIYFVELGIIFGLTSVLLCRDYYQIPDIHSAFLSMAYFPFFKKAIVTSMISLLKYPINEYKLF